MALLVLFVLVVCNTATPVSKWEKLTIPQVQHDPLEAIGVRTTFNQQPYVSLFSDISENSQCSFPRRTVMDPTVSTVLQCSGPTTIVKAVHELVPGLPSPIPESEYCSVDVTAAAGNRCNGSTSCYISPSSFTRCQYTYDSALDLTWACISANKTVLNTTRSCMLTDGWSSIRLQCASGVISIISASYGLTQNCSCSQNYNIVNDITDTVADVCFYYFGSETCLLGQQFRNWLTDICPTTDFRTRVVIDWICNSSCPCFETGNETIRLSSCKSTGDGSYSSPYCLDQSRDLATFFPGNMLPYVPKIKYIYGTISNPQTCDFGTIETFVPLDDLSSSPVATPSISKRTYFYEGCMDFYAYIPDYLMDTNNNMTINRCYDYCAPKGYTYFLISPPGAQNCYCTFAFERGTSRVDENLCAYRCNGDPTAYCGSNTTYGPASVFKIDFNPKLVSSLKVGNTLIAQYKTGRVYFCCSTIREKVPNWDGSFNLEIFTNGKVREYNFTLIVRALENATLSPLTFSSMGVISNYTLECLGYPNCTSSDVNCLQFPELPTIDIISPLITRAESSLTGIYATIPRENITIIPNTFSVFYVLAYTDRVTGLRIPVLPYTADNFLRGECRIVFHSLVDSSGHPISSSGIYQKRYLQEEGPSYLGKGTPQPGVWSFINQTEQICDPNAFQHKKLTLDQIFSILGSVNSSDSLNPSYSTVIYIAQLIASSPQWTSCEKLVEDIVGVIPSQIPIFSSECVTSPYDPNYNQDPCCNKTLSGCCDNITRSISINVLKPLSSIAEDRIQDQCTTPACTMLSIQNYVTSTSQSATQSVCGRYDNQIASLVPLLDSTTAFRQCVHDLDFSVINQYTANATFMIDCLLNHLDATTREYMFDNLNRQYPTQFPADLLIHYRERFGEFVDALSTIVGKRACTWFKSKNGLTKEYATLDSYCIIDEDVDCSVETCTDPGLYSPTCVDCSHFTCVSVGTEGNKFPNRCHADLPRNVFDVKTTCKDLAQGGIPCHYNPLVGQCIRTEQVDMLSCTSQPGCISEYIRRYSSNEALSDAQCYSYCYFELENEDLCTMEALGLNSTSQLYYYDVGWYSSSHYAAGGVCIYDSTWYGQYNTTWCTSIGGKFFHGWSYKGYTEEECFDNSRFYNGTCANIVGTAKRYCDESYCTACDPLGPYSPWFDDVCSNETSCNDLNFCSSLTGCAFVGLNETEYPCNYWSPVGCIYRSYNGWYIPDEVTCNFYGGVWLNGSTQQTCENFQHVCVHKGSNLHPGDGKPEGITLDDEASCKSCPNKEWVPLFTYQKASWVYKNSWQENKYLSLTESQKIYTFVNFHLWQQLQSTAVNRHLAQIYKSLLTCEQGQAKDLLSQIVCSCAGGCSGGGGIQTLEREVAIYGICSNSFFNTSSPLMEFKSTDFTTSNNEICVEVSHQIFDANQLESDTTRLGINSVETYQKYRESKRYITNANGIVVGTILSDGVGFSTKNINITNNGVTICVRFPSEEILEDISPFDVSYLSVYYSIDYVNILPVDNVILPVGTEKWCTNFNGSKVTYFAVGFIEDYKSLTYFQTWEISHLVLIYIVAIVDIAIFVITFYHVMCHVRVSSSGAVWSLPIVGLSILAIYLADRIIYFTILPLGTFQERPFLTVVFSDLPALLFLSIYSCVVVRWAEIYHFTMTSTKESNLHPVAIIFNVVLYIVFLAFIIAYFSLQVPVQTLTCTETSDIILTATNLSTAYKVFFLIATIIVAGAFMFYGGKLQSLIKDSIEASGKGNHTKHRSLRKLLLVTLACTMCQIGSAISLFMSFFLTYSTVTTFLTTCFFEVIPAGMLLYLFQYEGQFSSKPTRGTASQMTDEVSMHRYESKY